MIRIVAKRRKEDRPKTGTFFASGNTNNPAGASAREHRRPARAADGVRVAPEPVPPSAQRKRRGQPGRKGLVLDRAFWKLLPHFCGLVLGCIEAELFISVLFPAMSPVYAAEVA